MKHLLSVIGVLLLILCYSCKVKLIPVVETKIEYLNKLVYDSIYERDSIYVYAKGDTIYKYKELIKDRFILKQDTFIKVDSIPYPVVVKEVKETNRLYWWQKLFMWMGVAAIGYAIIKLKKLF